MSKYLVTDSVIGSTALVEQVHINTLRIQFKVLKIWGEYKLDPNIKPGYLYWIGKTDFEDNIASGNTIEVTEEDVKEFEFKMIKESEKSKKIDKKEENMKEPVNLTTLFTPFKFTHSDRTLVSTKNKPGDIDIGKITQTTSVYDINKDKTIDYFTMVFFGKESSIIIESSEFKKLNPVFFDDFIYPLPKEENGETNPPGV